MKEYDVVIIGAGVTGTALLYVLAKHTDVGRIAVIETYAGTAAVSSHAKHNSQTLHFGDIETNYTLEKAKAVKDAAEMIAVFAARRPGQGIVTPMQKMVLGVGEKQVALLRARHAEFRELFPEARFVERDELAKLEPKVVEGRDPSVPIAAIHSERGFGVDFGRLAAIFADEGKRARPGGVDLYFNAPVSSLRRKDGKFAISSKAGDFTADAVVVAAGAHSLAMAHRLGYGSDLTLLPVAGDFFIAPNVLKGKVYTVQEQGLPFAAVHADPDVLDGGSMRLGPIAVATPLLEPRRLRSMVDFFKVFRPNLDTIATVIKVNTDPVVLRFISRHILYYFPFAGRYLFAKDARKIIPSLKAGDIRFGAGLGGIRPQVANTRTRTLQLGEAKITDEGVIFNITPSPGASVCLKNAEDDARRLIAFFKGKFHFDDAAFRAEFGPSL